MDFLKRLVGGGGGSDWPDASVRGRGQDAANRGARPGPGKDVGELARRLGMTAEELSAFPVAYQTFTIPKRSGGARKIAAPAGPLKALQKKILRKLLARLKVHEAVRGFQPGQSIVTHALPHVKKAVVVHMDIKDFFPATTAKRVRDYFRRVGWDNQAADLLTKLCTHDGGLPQGAPTSPRLSNLVNYRMDVRLSALAAKLCLGDSIPDAAKATQATEGDAIHYTRYADDLTFSFDTDERSAVASVIRVTKDVLADDGYKLHQDKKLRIMRRGDRQMVTGLVVNDGVQLPRAVRRRLRAIRHHVAAGKPATLTPVQLAGWDSLEKMIVTQGRS
jgi:retron-type reverse transcriptase